MKKNDRTAKQGYFYKTSTYVFQHFLVKNTIFVASQNQRSFKVFRIIYGFFVSIISVFTAFLAIIDLLWCEEPENIFFYNSIYQ